MAHPLEEVIRSAERFVLIGDSSADRFPGFSYHSYTSVGKPFYCLDLGGLTESRGPTKGGKVYTSAAEIPADHGDLAIIWVKPSGSVRAVEIAHELGCKRVWFSFKTAHADAIVRARALGMDIIEVGRCPIYYMDDKVLGCKLHTLAVKASGLYGKPPATEADPNRREIL